MSNFCSDLFLCLWNVQFLSQPPEDDGFPNRAVWIFLSDEILTLLKIFQKGRQRTISFFKGCQKNLRVWIPVILRGVRIKKRTSLLSSSLQSKIKVESAGKDSVIFFWHISKSGTVKNSENSNKVHKNNCNHFLRTSKGLFKDHIRFSRTTYQEHNFTDNCTKINIPSPF